ncbi:hypothetical protein [Streptomyces griseus]|uniref:hypothetical protein n=1 Tax=Streptomyces griseus TaxID=1911 RepID=UPI00131B3BEA|nr:hypothetical protein [Streptomyces griseus]
MDASEPDGREVGAEFVDGLGEAFGVEPGGFAMGAGLVDALAAVGDDQGDERAGPRDHPEGEFHQVEERLRVQLRGVVDLLDVQEQDQAVEDAARDQDRGGEYEGERSADPPQPQFAFFRYPGPSCGRHDAVDEARRPKVAAGREPKRSAPKRDPEGAALGSRPRTAYGRRCLRGLRATPRRRDGKPCARFVPFEGGSPTCRR